MSKVKDLRKEIATIPDQEGLRLKAEFGAWQKIIDGEGVVEYRKGKESCLSIAGFAHTYVRFLGRHKFDMMEGFDPPAERFCIQYEYKGQDGITYDAVRDMTETERELFLMLLSIHKYLDILYRLIQENIMSNYDANYAIYWDTLEISTVSSNGPRFIIDVDNWGNGPHAQYINADGRLWAVRISYEDAVRYELETVEAPLTAEDVF